MGIDNEKIIHTLASTLYSDRFAEEYFEENLWDEELLKKIIDVVKECDITDAQIAGAYWISKYETDYLIKYENDLLEILQNDKYSDLVEGHIMMSLAKIKSKEGMMYIIENRFTTEMRLEAKVLKCYFENLK